jgi:hypothetical protein
MENGDEHAEPGRGAGPFVVGVDEAAFGRGDAVRFRVVVIRIAVEGDQRKRELNFLSGKVGSTSFLARTPMMAPSAVRICANVSSGRWRWVKKSPLDSGEPVKNFIMALYAAAAEGGQGSSSENKTRDHDSA